MRRARITFDGAFHHAMNRGYNGSPVFANNSDKKLFKNLLKKYSANYKININAYCIMDNHYHLLIQDNLSRMSDFFKILNGTYGMVYRKKYGGKGYVFQNRFKSEIVQDEAYLMVVIAYILNNPVKKNLCSEFTEYKWSSAKEYYRKNKFLTDDSIVRDLFNNYSEFYDFVINLVNEDLPSMSTPAGEFIGGEEFFNEAFDKFDRRKNNNREESKRCSDIKFLTVDKIYNSFEKENQILINRIDTSSFTGKRLRAQLLILLKDKGGLKYSEIIKLDLFKNIRLNSPGRMYRDGKMRADFHSK